MCTCASSASAKKYVRMYWYILKKCLAYLHVQALYSAYVYVYVHAHVRKLECTRNTYTCAYMQACIQACMRVDTCMCTYVGMRARGCVCVCVCVCVRARVRVCVHAPTCVDIVNPISLECRRVVM